MALLDSPDEILPIDRIRERIPPGSEFEELQFLGAEFTSATPDSGLSLAAYFKFSSSPAGMDVDGAEFVLRAERRW